MGQTGAACTGPALTRQRTHPVAKAKKTRTTSGKTPRDPPQPPEANPHFIGRFTPTRLTISPLYRWQQDSLGSMTLTRQRQYHRLKDEALKAGLSEAPPPPDRRGRQKKPDAELLLLPKLEQFLQRAKREGLEETAALRRWVTETKEGKQLRGKSTDAIVDRIQRKLRKFERLNRI
jgi:hypothetical protein